jgi:hypothetical protein
MSININVHYIFGSPNKKLCGYFKVVFCLQTFFDKLQLIVHYLLHGICGVCFVVTELTVLFINKMSCLTQLDAWRYCQVQPKRQVNLSLKPELALITQFQLN